MDGEYLLQKDFVNSRILLSGATNSTEDEETEEEDKESSSTKLTIDTAISRYKQNNYTKTVHCGREMSIIWMILKGRHIHICLIDYIRMPRGMNYGHIV